MTNYDELINYYETELNKVSDKLALYVNSYETQMFNDIVWDLIDNSNDSKALWETGGEAMKYFVDPENFDKIVKKLHEMWDNMKDEYLFENNKGYSDFIIIDGVKYIDENTEAGDSFELYSIVN